MLKFIVIAAIAAAAAFLLYAHGRRHPEDLPWATLDLGRPVGAFTGRKLTALTGDAPQCRALLTRAGVPRGAAELSWFFPYRLCVARVRPRAS